LDLYTLDSDDISSHVNLEDIRPSFERLLSRDDFENRIFEEFRSKLPYFFIETTLREIYDLRLPHMKGVWDEGDWICAECWRNMVKICGRDWWLWKRKN